MLGLGVFGGNYFGEAEREELPDEWFEGVRIATNGIADEKLNFFEVAASQPLEVWQRKGWIHPADPLGWFQWYCRYSLGRRMDDEDQRQIKRWKAMNRHVAQVKQGCQQGDLSCRRKQRQALLHWTYDSRKL